MAQHTYFPSRGFNASTADVIVKCLANGAELPAHRLKLAALSPQLEAAVAHSEIRSDATATDLVEELVGSSERATIGDDTAVPRLYLQSTSEESVRLLLGHAYGIEIANRLCIKTACEVALVAKKYDIMVLLTKVDAFLARAMEDRTTDRLRCKHAFWTVHRKGITSSAFRFLIFAEQAGLVLMRSAVANLLAHIAVLDPEQDLRQFELAQEIYVEIVRLKPAQVSDETWERINMRTAQLRAIVINSIFASSGSSSPTTPFDLSSTSSTTSPPGSPASAASSSCAAPQTSGAFQKQLSRPRGSASGSNAPGRKRRCRTQNAPQPAIPPLALATQAGTGQVLPLSLAQQAMIGFPVRYGYCHSPAGYWQPGCGPATMVHPAAYLGSTFPHMTGHTS